MRCAYNADRDALNFAILSHCFALCIRWFLRGREGENRERVAQTGRDSSARLKVLAFPPFSSGLRKLGFWTRGFAPEIRARQSGQTAVHGVTA